MDAMVVFLIVMLGLMVLAMFTEVVVSTNLNINIFEFLYLLYKRGFMHFLAKRKLVKGDIVYLKFKGKLRKALIRENILFNNSVTLDFEDSQLNMIEYKDNQYGYGRIHIPDYMKGAARLLFGDEQ